MADTTTWDPAEDARRAARAERVRQAVPGAVVIVLITLGLMLLATPVAGNAFYREHFAHVPLAWVIASVGTAAAAATVARLVWPGTREGDLLARHARALTASLLVVHVLDVTLDAPVFAAYAILALLLAPTIAFVRFVARYPVPRRMPLIVAAASGVIALIMTLVEAHLAAPARWWLLGALGVVHLVTGPLAIRCLRTVWAREGTATDTAGRLRSETAVAGTRRPVDHLDIPPGTLDPGAGSFMSALLVGLVLFVGLVVAPGVPTGSFVRWVITLLLVPVLVHGFLRRDGVIGPGRAAGPYEMRAHPARVAHLPDERLALLDAHIAAFIATGFGRRRLARALAETLASVIDDLDAEQLQRRFRRAPIGLGPGRRRARSRWLARLLGVPLDAANEGKPSAAQPGGLVPGGTA